MESRHLKYVITGANGHLGLQLIKRFTEEDDNAEVIALVRSERAAATVRGVYPDLDIRIVDYRDSDSLRASVPECDVLIHLVGIIKQSAANTFKMAHEDVSQAIVEAQLAAGHIVTLGILGTTESAANACFQSRFNAEQILLNGQVPVSVIRVPMVIGPDDYASRSLTVNGLKSRVLSFRAESLEQPIDAEDVVRAVVAAARLPAENRVLELAGPESLSRRDLIRRAGKVFNNEPKVISLPVGLGYLLASVFETVSSNPPVTRAMLGVLDHDDVIDPSSACQTLGITLTPLDETLNRILPTIRDSF